MALKPPKLENRDIEPLTLRGAFKPSSLNEETRTVEVQWTTGEKVLRNGWDGPYFEELALDPKNVRMGRLSSGRAPFLADHSASSIRSVIGVVEAATIGSARIRFAKDDPDADAVWNKVRQGILPNVSVGYRTYKAEKTKGGEGETPTFRAVDWEPHEISLVAIGADSTAQVRSAVQEKHTCVFVTPSQESRTMTPEEIEAARKAAEAVEMKRQADLEAASERGAQAERERVTGIRAAARAIRGFDPVAADKMADDLCSRKVSLADARTQILEDLAKRSEQTPINTSVPAVVASVGEEQREKMIRGAQAAIIQRAGLTKDFESLKARNVRGFKDFESDPGEFAGMRLSRLAQEFLERSGVSTRGMNDETIVSVALTQQGRASLAVRATGYAPASDFAVLLENVMHKSLLGAYNTAPDTWKKFCKTDTVSDFRDSNRYRTGSFGVLDALSESGEYVSKAIPDGTKSKINTATKGNMIAITRQALVNDDLSALTSTLGGFGRMAGLTIETDVYALLTANGGLGATSGDGSLGDTYAFFDATRGNIGTGGALSVSSLDADRVTMAQQLDPSGNEYLDLRPSVLLVPIGLGSSARVLNFAEYDPSQSNKFMVPNVVRGLFAEVVDSPRLSGTRRYMFANPADAAAIVVAFLNGIEAPYMEQQLGWRTDGTEFKIRLDAKAQFFDPKGALTNAGA